MEEEEEEEEEVLHTNLDILLQFDSSGFSNLKLLINATLRKPNGQQKILSWLFVSLVLIILYFY